MNQSQLSAPRPPLELPLARDHFRRSNVLLDIYQSRHSVPLGEPFDLSLLMLENSPVQVVGRADIKHSRLAAHDVNVVAHRFSARGTARDPSLRSG